VLAKGVAGLVAVVVAGCWAVSAAIADGSPAASVAASLKAALAESSVHYVSTGGYGDVHVTQVADVGVRSGVQRITVRAGRSSGLVTVIVSGGNAYIRASDVFVLVGYMGFNPQAAARYVGRWVLIPPTDGDFATVSAAVTLPTTVEEIGLSRRIRRSPATTKNGRSVDVFSGKTPRSLGTQLAATLYASATGTPLPVEEQVHQGTVESTLVFSDWNESITAAAPAGAIQISKTGLESAGEVTA
jgi:hypothetical protein